jgi:hypothetical protein
VGALAGGAEDLKIAHELKHQQNKKVKNMLNIRIIP